MPGLADGRIAMLRGIDHIDIAVDDLEKWAHFLETIGFAIIRRTAHGGGSVELRFPGTDRPFLELTSTRRPNGSDQPEGFRHIALRSDNIAETFASLTAKGVAVDRPPRKNADSGRMTMNAIDPAGGISIQFVE
jgi:4-hydroxyphenylpyruvate dioxygenase-like putative hemolysin